MFEVLYIISVAAPHRGQPRRRSLQQRDALQQLNALHVRVCLSPLGCLLRLHGADEALRLPPRPPLLQHSLWHDSHVPRGEQAASELVRAPEVLPWDSVEVGVGSLGERVCVVEGWCRACVGPVPAGMLAPRNRPPSLPGRGWRRRPGREAWRAAALRLQPPLRGMRPRRCLQAPQRRCRRKRREPACAGDFHRVQDRFWNKGRGKSTQRPFAFQHE